MSDEKKAATEKKKVEKGLTEELEQSFPASDPPSSTQPGSGVTGAEVKRTLEVEKPAEVKKRKA